LGNNDDARDLSPRCKVNLFWAIWRCDQVLWQVSQQDRRYFNKDVSIVQLGHRYQQHRMELNLVVLFTIVISLLYCSIKPLYISLFLIAEAFLRFQLRRQLCCLQMSQKNFGWGGW